MYGYKQPLKLEEIPVPDIIALAETGRIKDSLTEVRFDDVNATTSTPSRAATSSAER